MPSVSASYLEYTPDKSGQAPLNILELCFSRSAGGLELYMANISRSLRERGHNVTAVVHPESFLAGRLSGAGVPTFPLRHRMRYLDVFTAVKLARLIGKRHIDILHLHQSKDLSTAILARKIAGRGKILFTQQMESSRRKKDFFHRWVYRNLDGLIPITRRIELQVKRNTAIPANRIFQLYYGIDLRRYFPNKILRESWREQYGISPRETVIGTVGRLEPGKGQQYFLSAAAQVKKRLNNLRFIIIGGETVGQHGFLAELKRLCRRLGLENDVIFTGFVENVHELLNVLDVVVLATKKETFGLSLIEAMAVGVAPIGTNAGGVPEIIEHNRNGLLVPPLDAETLAEAMFKLAGDRGKRRRMAQAARKTVEEKFDIQEHLYRLEKIFYYTKESR